MDNNVVSLAKVAHTVLRLRGISELQMLKRSDARLLPR